MVMMAFILENSRKEKEQTTHVLSAGRKENDGSKVIKEKTSVNVRSKNEKQHLCA